MPILSQKQRASLLGILLMLLLWEVVAQSTGNPLLFPSVTLVGRRLFDLFIHPAFYRILTTTLLRGLLGMFSALLLSLLLAYSRAKSSFFEELTRFPLALLRSIPVVSLLLLLILWITPENIPFVMAWVVMIPIVTEHLTRGFQSLKETERIHARIFKLSSYTYLSQIIYPGIKPQLYGSLTASTGMAWKAIILGEALAQPQIGIGTSLKEAQNYLDVSGLIAWTVIAVAIGYGSELLLKYGEDKKIPIRYCRTPKITSALSPAPDITVQHLSFHYQKTLFENRSFSLPTGTYCAIRGESGIGKSTLLHLLCGIIPLQQGFITPAPAKIPYGLLRQDFCLLEHLTAFENIALVLARFDSKESIIEKIQSIAKEIDIDMILNQKIRNLSHGEKQRIALATVLLYPSSILFLDEPFTGLDPLRREKMKTIIASLHRDHKKSIVLVSHISEDLTDATQHLSI